jgi:hypothetical protein
MTIGGNSKVAVIVVHGVAYHAPGASARAASELLHGLRPKGKESPYGPDTQETVSIPLKQLKISKPLPESEAGWISQVPILRYFARVLQERTVFLTRAWREMPTSDDFANERVANDFMRLLLQDYRGVDRPVEGADDHDEAASYVTTRIKMTREEPRSSLNGGVEGSASAVNVAAGRNAGDPSATGSAGAQAKKEVHIYECYWADLSRPKNTILSFFQGLYQILFHLGSLSRLAISTGADAKENRDRRIWKWLDWTQNWAVRILALPIPILNLILFISLFGALPHLLSEHRARVGAVASAALLGLLVCAIVSRWMAATPWPLTWAAIPFVFASAFGGLAWLVASEMSPWSLLAVEGWLLGAGIVYLSVSSYDEVRDGAKEVAWTFYGVSLAAFVGILWLIREQGTSIEQATLWMVQVILAALRASWALLFLFAFVALVLGSLAWRSIPAGAGRARAKAAVRTSRFALAMPAMGILIVTLALWSGLFVKTTKSNQTKERCCQSSVATKLFNNSIPKLLDLPADWGGLFLDESDAQGYLGSVPCPQGMPPNDYFQGVLVWSATPAFPVVLAVLSTGFFLVLLWLLPSVFTEMKPPRGSDNASSRRMGAWLSRGLDATAIGFVLMWTAAFLLPVLFLVLHEWKKSELNSLDSPTAAILQWLGLATGSLAILASVAKSGSSVLGIMLDVDNYLRTSPKEKTPRARIMERYVSLLRYLADGKDESRKYDRIVILAHSLGALISGDLLLYLKSQGDPELARLGLETPEVSAEAKIPIRLFTMGDPVRQFLNRMFPYLYEWVRGTPDNSLKHLGGLVPTLPNTPPAGTPNPDRLGVDLWVNAYRSGDYIGRSLWLDEWYSRTAGAGSGAYPEPVYIARSAPGQPRREEMCIGAGAHQHYWDQSAPDIAEKLDELIR